MATALAKPAVESASESSGPTAGTARVMSDQVASTSAQEQKDAYMRMGQPSAYDQSSVPHLMLTGNDNGTDQLQGATIETGGYNAVVGAKVPAGAIGVVTKFGYVYPTALDAGWHWKAPWQHVEMMSTRLHADTIKAQASSHDLQQVTTELTVPFSLKAQSGPDVYAKIGNLEQVEAVVINPGVLESVKAIAAKYTAEELITKREAVKDEVELALKNYVALTLKEKGLDEAVSIGNLAITHFNFSDDFNRSIELKVKAEQDALRAQNEKRQKVTEAEATRDSQKAKADGEAYSTEVKSKAEAEAIKRRGEALKANPRIVDLQAVEKWDGRLPVYTGGSSPVPFINIDQLKKDAQEVNLSGK